MAVLNFFDVLALRPNFFDDADIDSRLDKEELKMAILTRCGTLLPVYTDTKMFKMLSDSFFMRRKLTISKLIDSTLFEYNPIDNYNRIETVKRNYKGESTNETGTEVESNHNNSQENKVSAYNSDVYQPRESVSGNLNGKDTTNVTDTGTNTIDETVETKTRGNIGVTTSQEMLEQERKVVLFNVYDWIAIEFEQNFFICVS